MFLPIMHDDQKRSLAVIAHDLVVLDTREIRAAVMPEALALAYGSNMFSDPESKMVHKVPCDLRFSDEKFTGMKNWAEVNAVLLAQATEIMNAK